MRCHLEAGPSRAPARSETRDKLPPVLRQSTCFTPERRIQCWVILLAVLLGLPGDALAQEVAESFTDLRRQQILSVGDTVWVAYVEEGGGPAHDVKGWFLDATDSSLTVLADQTELLIEAENVRRITRERRGPLWDGALIGAAVGGGVATLLSWGFADDASDQLAIIAVYAAGGAGIGLGIDALVKERKIVFLDPALTGALRRIEVAPLISKERKGML